VVAKVRERLAVRKHAAQKFEFERYNLRKLSELEVENSIRQDLNHVCNFGELTDSEDINRAWRNIKENFKTSAKASLGLYELKQHKPWFCEECSQF
jgi:hypothetical protein